MLKNGLKKLSAVLAVSAIAIGMSPICMPSNAIRKRVEKRNPDTSRQAELQRRVEAHNREGRELNMMSLSLVMRTVVLDMDRPAPANRVTLITNLVTYGIQGVPNLNIGSFDQDTQDLIREADNLFHRLTAHRQEEDRLIEAGANFAE